MTEISAQLVKQLRDRTGAGMMDAKKALVEAAGDMEKAVDILRLKGVAKAASKGDREANAGVIAVACDGSSGVMVEINSETDFVARNEKFQAFAEKVLEAAVKAEGSLEKLLASKLGAEDFNTALTSQIATTGEKLEVKRSEKIEVRNGAVVAYIHNKMGAKTGLIGVLLGIESSADKAKIAEVGDQIAMHIAAAAPIALDAADVPADKLAREKAIAAEKAAASGKPAEIVAKMVDGAIRKYYDEVVLLEQAFFIDPSKKIKDIVKTISPDAKIVKFARYQIG